MPVLGTGLIPSGPIGLELEATVRRVFSQMVVVLLYRQNPLLALLLRNAIRASGGVSPYTQPVQTGQYVPSSWIGPAGNFNIPSDVAATVNAEFNLCALATPVSSLGLEQLVTQDAVAVASRLMLKMNDIKNSSLSALSNALFGPPTPSALQMYSLQDAYGNATLAPTYGGLSRTTYPNWAGLNITGAGAILTRSAFIPKLLQSPKYNGGEALDFVVLSVEDWTTLLTDFLSLERYNNDPSSRWGKDDPVNSGFRGLLLGDTPLFFDLNLPAGTAIGFNSKYITLVIHEDANFAWTGWYSTIPQGQIASVGVSLTALNLVCSKPSTGMIIQGITGGQTFTPQPAWPVPPLSGVPPGPVIP
ncbi:MAG TPA: phage major capsid protein [Candidatus Acidoferrum sp.]